MSVQATKMFSLTVTWLVRRSGVGDMNRPTEVFCMSLSEDYSQTPGSRSISS